MLPSRAPLTWLAMLPRCPNKNKHHSENQCLFSTTYTSDGAKHVCRSRFCDELLPYTLSQSILAPTLRFSKITSIQKQERAFGSETISTLNHLFREYHQTNKAPQEAAYFFSYFLSFLPECQNILPKALSIL